MADKSIGINEVAELLKSEIRDIASDGAKAGTDFAEEFMESAIKGIKKHSKELKSETAKLFEDFNRMTNNFKSRKSVSSVEWQSVLRLSEELLKSDRYADSVRDKLSDIAVTFKNIGKVSGIDNVVKELAKAEHALESVQWSEAGKNYKKKSTVKKTRASSKPVTADPAPVVDAEKTKQKEVVKTTETIKEETEAQQKLNAVQKEADNLSKKKSDQTKSVKDVTEHINKQGDAIEKTKKKMLNMESVVKRYNKLMNGLALEHLTIGTRLSEDTDGWGLKEMVDEAKYQLSRYFESGNTNADMRYGSAEERKAWKSETEQLKRFIAAYEPYVDMVESTTPAVKSAAEATQKQTDALHEQKKEAEAAAEAASQQNKVLISSYQELYNALKKVVELSKQLKPEQTAEFSDMQTLMDRASYPDGKESLVANIKAQYDNVQRIKSSIKNGLSVYKDIDGDGYEATRSIEGDTLKNAEDMLRAYIYQAIEFFGYTVTDVMNDFSQKRARTFIEKTMNQYLAASGKNDEYRADAEVFNAPIKEVVDSITSTILSMTTDTKSMERVLDTLFELKSRAQDVNRYTLSSQANTIGSKIGINTPYDEIQSNARKIESYEELCEVVDRYNELQKNAIIFGGNDRPGLSETEEMERRTLSARLEATGGKDIYKLSGFDGFKDVEKLANVLGIEIPQAIEKTEAAQAEFTEETKDTTDAQNKLKESVKDTSNVLYHAGDLSNISGTLKSFPLGNVPPTRSNGIGGLTGLYTTDDLDGFIGNEWQGAPISTIDPSGYNLLNARNNEIAEKVGGFLNDVNATIYGYYNAIDENDWEMKRYTDVKSVEELYEAHRELFKESSLTFEQFAQFINASREKIAGKSFADIELPAIDEGIAKSGISSAMQDVAEEIFNSDSFQTQFLKMLGYEGVDLRGTNYNGTYTGGSVIFDVKPESVKATNEKWSDVMLRNGFEVTEDDLKYEERRRQLAFDTAKAYSQQADATKEVVGVQKQLDSSSEVTVADELKDTFEVIQKGESITGKFVTTANTVQDALQKMRQALPEEQQGWASYIDDVVNREDDRIVGSFKSIAGSMGDYSEQYKLESLGDGRVAITFSGIRGELEATADVAKSSNQTMIESENKYQQELEETAKIQQERKAQADAYAEAATNLLGAGYESIPEADQMRMFTDVGNKIYTDGISAAEAMDQLYMALEAVRKQSESMPDDVIDDFGIEGEKVQETVSQLQKLSSIDATRVFDSVDLKGFLESFNIDKSNFATFRTLFEELMQITKAMADGVDVGNAFNLKMEEIANTIMSLGGHMMDLSDDGYADMIKRFYQHMSDTKVQFNSTIKADYTKDQWKSLYNTYKNRLTSDLTKGIPADSLYQELSGLFPSLFPEGVLSQQDQFKLIFDKLDEARQLQANNWKTLHSFASSDRDGIQSGVDDIYGQMSDALFAGSSATQLNTEADAFKEVEQSATKAANAKGKFSKENKKLGEGAAESANHLDDEADNLDDVNRAAAEMPDVSAYDSVSMRLDADGNPYSVSGTARTEMDDGLHYRTTDTYQFDNENNRWDMLGSVQSVERTREMVQALEEYYKIQNRIQKLRLDTSNQVHASSIDKLETDDLARAEQRLLNLGVQVNDIEGQINLSLNQRQALLDVELRARQEMYDVIAKMEDKQATTAVQPYQKTVAGELRKSSKIDSDIRLLGEDGVSAQLQGQVVGYRRLLDELVDLRLQLASDPGLVNDADFSNRFTDTANRAEKARVAIEGVFKESQKLSKIGKLKVVGDTDVSNVDNLKAAMIAFANSTWDGEVKIQGFNKEGTQMYVTLNQGAGAVENITVALNKATGHLNAFTTGTSKATNEWNDFKKQAASGIARTAGMYLGFNDLIRYGRKGLEYVKEIDLAMTELKKVTDETDASYKEFLKDAGGTAAVIGSTISDFTEASATFARLGYSLEESSSMAETAIIYKNVADGLDSVEESSESIISTMMAFGIEANDTMSIIDRFNAVGNAFAITSAGIGEALQRSASALYSAGNTIDESVALVTAANAVIQNPEQVGTALKTLSLRLRGAKTELEEAGEDVEGMAENTSELQAKLKALTHGKVDIMIDADTFKSTTQILREMSAAWEEMTDIERASALELMGGKRQSNILSSVITNFETVEEVIETSMDSSGSAMAENEKWLDSIEGKTYQFTNALQTMWSNMLDSEMIKGFLDFGTDAIQFLDTGTGKVVALVAALKLMAKFKGFSIGGIAKGLGDTIQNITKAQQTLQALSSVSPVTGPLPTESINAYAKAVAGLTAKQQANLLASQNLTKQDIQRVLQTNKCTEAEMREAMAHVRTKTTKDQEAVASKVLFAAKTQEMAATYRNSAATLQGAAADEALTAATILETAASENASQADLLEMISQSNLTAATKQQIIAELGLTGAKKAGEAANYGLLASIEALYASNPIGWILAIISGIIMLISWLTNLEDGTQKIIDKAKEAEDAINSLNDELKSDTKTVTDCAERFAELAQGVDMLTGKNLSLSTDDYEEFLDLSNQLADIFPTLSRNYDENGNAIVQLSGDTDTIVGSLKALLDVQRQITNQQIAENLPDLYKGVKQKSNQYNTELEDLISKRDTLEGQLKKIQNSDIALNVDDWANGGIIDFAKEGKSAEEFNHMVDDYIKILTDAGFKLEYLSTDYEYDKDAMVELPTNFYYKISNLDFMSDEEIDAAKGKITSGINELAATYSTEVDNLYTKIQTATDSNKANWKSLSSSIAAWLSTDSTYQILNDDMQSMVQTIINNLDYTSLKFESWEGAQAWIQDYIVQQFANAENREEIQTAISSLLTVDVNKTSYTLYNGLKTAILNAIANLPVETQDAIKKALGLDDESEYDQYFSRAQAILQDEFDSMASDLTLSDLKIISQLDIPTGTLLSWDELQQKIDEVRNAYDTSTFSLSAYQEKVENLNGSLDNIQSAYNTLTDVVKEYNKTGYLTLDTLQALLELDPQYLAMLQMENGQLSINRDAAIALVEAKLAEAKATALDTAIKRLNTLASRSSADALADNATASTTAADALGDYAAHVSNAGAEAAIAAGKIAVLNAAITNADANEYVKDHEWQQVLDDYNNTIAMIDSLGANLGSSLSSIMSDDKSSDSSKKDFNFIDIYFTNLENKISERTAKLETLLDDTSQLNLKKKISDEIVDYYRQQSASAQKAAEYYSNEAAKTLSKIPAKYRNAIQNGTLNIASISDDSLNDLLTKYRDYVDKASDYTEKYWSSLEEVANKAKEKFDDVQSDYDNKISFNDLFTTQIQNEIDKAEEAGETVSKSYYEALIDNNEKELELLRKEQADLLEILQSGDVKENTDQYYEMVSALGDIDSAIDECEKETIGWVNAMNEIDTEQFDKLIDKIDRLNEEIQNMYDLFENEDNLVDDTGNWTEDGITALALLVQQMENAKYAADEVAKEIASLKPEDFSSTELYEERINDLKDTHWDYIQQAEDAEQSIIDLNKTRIDAVKDGMEKELEATKELIKAKKEALDVDKEQYEFEKTMAEHSKNIAEIERKLAALSNDHSMEAEAKKRRLLAELAEAQAERQESLRDKNYDDISKAYDDEEEAAEESHRLMEEKLELYLEDTERIINESLMNVLANADIVLENLNNTAGEHGVVLSDNLLDPWKKAAKEAENFKTIAAAELGGLVGEDGTITIFSVECEDYLTSPFVSGEQASAKFKETVAGHLSGIKNDLESTYKEAEKRNKDIINECNKAIEAYQNVRAEASKPVSTITSSDGNLSDQSTSNQKPNPTQGGTKKGNDVKELQKYLNSYFNAGLEEDGSYGPKTKAAVKKVQSQIGVSSDGLYNSKTVKALQDYWDKLIEGIKKNNPGNGSSMLGQGIAEYTRRKNAVPAALYGKGTMGATKDHWAITDEPWLGDELVLIPGPNGNLQYMRKGTSVIPADITEKLMSLALDPTPTLEKSRPVISAPHIENNSFVIDNSIGEIIHIENCTQETLPDIKKIVNEALENHTKRLNQSLKRFTR